MPQSFTEPPSPPLFNTLLTAEETGYPPPLGLGERYTGKISEEEIIVCLNDDLLNNRDTQKTDDTDNTDDEDKWWVRGTWTHPIPSPKPQAKSVVIIVHGLFSWRNQLLIQALARDLSLGSDDDYDNGSSKRRRPISDDIEVTPSTNLNDPNVVTRVNALLSSLKQTPEAEQTKTKTKAKSNRYTTLRFDLRGNAGSPSKWHYDSTDRDVVDLERTTEYAIKLGYTIAGIIGHSAGSRCVMSFSSKVRESGDYKNLRIGKIVNMAGRFEADAFGTQSRFTSAQLTNLKVNGGFMWDADWLDGRRVHYVDQESIESRRCMDMKKITNVINKDDNAKVLTIHGKGDEVVPYVGNADGHARFAKRHLLVGVEGGNHSFNGLRYREVLSGVVREFLEVEEGVGEKER